METAGARSREILRYRRDPHRRDPQAAHLPPIMLLYNTVHQPNYVWTVTRGALLGELPPASFPFDGSESASAISAVSPSVRPRISQSRVTPGNLRTIRTAISLLSGAPHSTLLHLRRSTPRKLANACWARLSPCRSGAHVLTVQIALPHAQRPRLSERWASCRPSAIAEKRVMTMNPPGAFMLYA